MAIQRNTKIIDGELKNIIISNFNSLISNLNEIHERIEKQINNTLDGEAVYQQIEQYCSLARSYASETHKLKMSVDWGIPPSPEWMNHYQDWFYQALDRRTTFWLERGTFARLIFDHANPPKVLELCCGDGFFTKFFYSPYAQSITALDFDVNAINHAKTFNSIDNVAYLLADIRYELPDEKYDNVIWDVAIEHFSDQEIDLILNGIKSRLHHHGVLAGYTLVEKDDGTKHIHQHEREFKSKEDLLNILSPHFNNVKVFETFVPERHNLYFFASDHTALPFDAGWPQITIKKISDDDSVHLSLNVTKTGHPPTQYSPQQHSHSEDHTICFVGTCYDGFIAHHYQLHPELLQMGYQTQLDGLLGTGFGDADFYSRGMSLAGWHASDVVVNCAELQGTWAREHGFSGDLIAILVEQMRRLKPDVIYLQNLTLASAEILQRLRPHTRLIVGQIASGVPASANLQGLDIIVSSFPHFVQRFRQAGLCAYYQPLAFAPRILSQLGRLRPQLPFTFIGGISGYHSMGTQLLADVAALTPLQVWGYGADCLPSDSLLRQRHQGEAWGLNMFQLMHSSCITLNRHIDTAERFANNMRLFEATGSGAMLLTDYKDNLADLFRIGEEVVAYRSANECADLVNYYLNHTEEAEAIALAGQARTLKDHTYDRRMAHTAEILDRHLRQPEARRRFGSPGNISYGYQQISSTDQLTELGQAWKHPAIPERQRALVELQLEQLYHGQVNPIFQVLADLLDAIVLPNGRVLEIGCSSGYYYEIIEYLLNRRLDFIGVDYSEAFIGMARGMYPTARFETADGTALPFDDHSLPCVISSCILLHALNFRDHIRETARVAQAYVIAHRTPICRQSATQVMKKLAYEVETVELRFNETEFIQAFLDSGLVLDRCIEYLSHPDSDQYEASYRFRFPNTHRPELNP